MPLMGVGLKTIWTQFFPPQPPPMTETNIPDLTGKVFIVTGGSSGIGFELSKMLYRAGGKVYILSRTASNCSAAITKIQSDVKPAVGGKLPGSLESILIDLQDLSSVQQAAKAFLAKESRLDVLFNNAGVAHHPHTHTKQGLEIHIGINTVGHFLLTKLLMPLLATTAKSSPPNSVRAVWPASIMCETTAPKGGVLVDKLDNLPPTTDENYSASKTANWFAAYEFAKRTGRETGVVNIAGNPGSYVTQTWRTTPWYMYYPFVPLLRNPVHGAYTYLWMAFSNDVGMDEAVAGRYGTCDGRWHPGQRKDLLLALKTEEGGTGQAKALFEWCEAKVAPFLS